VNKFLAILNKIPFSHLPFHTQNGTANLNFAVPFFLTNSLDSNEDLIYLIYFKLKTCTVYRVVQF